MDKIYQFLQVFLLCAFAKICFFYKLMHENEITHVCNVIFWSDIATLTLNLQVLLIRICFCGRSECFWTLAWTMIELIFEFLVAYVMSQYYFLIVYVFPIISKSTGRIKIAIGIIHVWCRVSWVLGCWCHGVVTSANKNTKTKLLLPTIAFSPHSLNKMGENSSVFI